jgi:2-polyprenyl-3-methyl-5-hydroxy-6-metoxy-1,4-benzoquinol methylase
VGESGAECAACATRYPAPDGILRLTLGREGAPGYDPHFFQTLERVEDRHFWFVERRAVILETLLRAAPEVAGAGLFDIGCGSGGLLGFLSRSGIRVVGACDAYLESLEIVRRRQDVPLVLVDEGRLPPLGPGHRALALFDVLEHLDDDREMLGFLFQALAPGGVLALTVPAHPVLFGPRDEMARHRRRYRRSDLRHKLEEAGFAVRTLTHFMASLVPLLLAGKALGRLRPRPTRRHSSPDVQEFRVVPVLNDLLRVVLSLERRWLRFGSLPLGSSIVAVAVRPEEAGR